MYYGEVNIFQEELEAFLQLAEEFKLKGLQKTSLGGKEIVRNFEEDNNFSNMDVTQRNYKFQNNEDYENITHTEDNPYKSTNEIVPAGFEKISMENLGLEQYDEKIKSLMEKQLNTWVCKICGKTTEVRTNLSHHIEAKHITGMEHPCSTCGKIYRSRASLKSHTSQLHSKVTNEFGKIDI